MYSQVENHWYSGTSCGLLFSGNGQAKMRLWCPQRGRPAEKFYSLAPKLPAVTRLRGCELS